MRVCDHIECLGKQWRLEHKTVAGWVEWTPKIKIIGCLAEGRKALISYMKNPDFKDVHFRIKAYTE